MRVCLTLAVLGAVGLACLAGCARPAAPPEAPEPMPDATEAVAGPPSGKLTVWTIWNAEPRKSALDRIVADFERQHPEVDVEVSHFEPDAYKTTIRVALGGDQPPDVFFVWSGEKMLDTFIRGGNCLDITPFLDADGGKWRGRIVPASLRAYEYDGKIYGVPYLLQCTFFAYNKDIFARHGAQVPTTWDELIAVCERLKEAGVTPIALGNRERWPAHHYPGTLFQRLMGHDAVMAQYDPLGPGDYAEPGWIKGLRMFDEFQQRGFFNPSPNGVSRADARAMFYGERAAMFYTGTWDFAQFTERGEAPSSFWDKWDFFNFPAVEGGAGEQDALAGSADGYVISAKTRNPGAAVAFLQHLTSVDMARRFVNDCVELVQVVDAVSEEDAPWYLRKYARMVAEAEVISPWTDTMMELSVAEAFMNGIQGMLAGQKTPEQIMEDVRRRQAAVKRELDALQ